MTFETQKDHFINTSIVLSVLKTRRNEGYIPSTFTDSYRVGLVIEGGGMRGVISCAAADALYQLGYGNCFDYIYGTSAGAINGAYFLSGQITMGTSIFYENLIGNNFINLLRWPYPMDLDYLFNEWITKGKKLDTKKVLDSKTALYITTTDCATGEPHYFCNHELNDRTLIAALKASSSVPLYSRNKELIGDRLYNDGMIHDQIPINKAIESGCTHIVCLLTKERGFRKKTTMLEFIIESIKLRKFSEQYKTAYLGTKKKYNEFLDTIYNTVNPKSSILAIAPEPGDFMISNAETEQKNLIKVTKDSLSRVANILKETKSTKLYIDKD